MRGSRTLPEYTVFLIISDNVAVVTQELDLLLR